MLTRKLLAITASACAVASSLFVDTRDLSRGRAIHGIVRSVVRKASLPNLNDMFDHHVPQKLEAESGGVAYYGKVHVGGQEQIAIFDTGSFDVVIQGACGAASTNVCTGASRSSLHSERRATANLKTMSTRKMAASVTAKGGVNARAAMDFDVETEPETRLGALRGLISDDPCQAFWAQAEATVAATTNATSEGHTEKRTCCAKDKCPHACYLTSVSGDNFCMLEDGLDSITYGSGTVVTKQAVDHIAIKSDDGTKVISKQKVPVKIVVNADLKIFKYFSFAVIFGIGAGPSLSKDDPIRYQRPLYALGIRQFTYCLDHDPERGGGVVWNDVLHSEWKTVPVSGAQFWSTGVHNFGLLTPGSKTKPTGCEKGCSGVIDTGSTLLIVTHKIADSITDFLKQNKVTDCSDLKNWPNLTFTLGMSSLPQQMIELTLGPEAYLTDAGEQSYSLAYQKVGTSRFPLFPMHHRDFRAAQDSSDPSLTQSTTLRMCALAVDTQPCETDTVDGPEMILGMPLFHKYKVQFDLSSDQDGNMHTRDKPSRFMHFGEKATTSCDDIDSSLEEEIPATPLRKLDIWSVPHWHRK